MGDIAAHIFHFLRQPPLLPELYSMIAHYASGNTAPGLSTQLPVFLFFIFYLFCITASSVVLGNCAAYWFDRFGFSFVNDAFTSIGRTRRRGAITICSALCNFGEGGAFVIYRGLLAGIVLTGDNAIGQILIRQVERAVLRVDAGSVYVPASVSHTDPIKVAGLSDQAELVLPGAVIENLVLDPLIIARQRTFCEKLWLWSFVVIRAAIIVVPIFCSLSIYYSLAAHGPDTSASSAAASVAPADIEAQLNSVIKLDSQILNEVTTTVAKQLNADNVPWSNISIHASTNAALETSAAGDAPDRRVEIIFE